MPGCFGRRKKRSKDSKEPKEAKPEPNSSSHHGNDRTAASSPPAASAAAVESDRAAKQKQQQANLQAPVASQQQQQQQQTQQQSQQKQRQEPQQPDEASEVSETITVARSQSVHHAAPKPGNIKKAATMSRYDFLRKQDNINYADRWATLKQRYLAPANPADAQDGGAVVVSAVTNGPKLRSSILTAQSLPRQFSPPSTVVSPVKFSNWFYERQAREAEARRESQNRESRMLQIFEGPTPEEMEEAAVKIQAGFKGYKTRKDFKARKEMQQPSP